MPAPGSWSRRGGGHDPAVSSREAVLAPRGCRGQRRFPPHDGTRSRVTIKLDFKGHVARLESH